MKKESDESVNEGDISKPKLVIVTTVEAREYSEAQVERMSDGLDGVVQNTKSSVTRG